MGNKIQFNNQPQNLAELNDALTGAALDKSLGLYQCQNCFVHYHAESHQALQASNNGQCVACESSTIEPDH
ncbi:hypothetical protein [Vibrio agarivorans]|uniref:C2H2-type domain-containing protein n=1 Tax=Vibrio agarivorans TaxID=153622 RepID=A0ABT7Y729_9VIBR|nr:hypothetical protein [Vibrio agarivorans]MDN2483848.1 hypothetical protein [Vibrio agarivorans]